MKSNHQIKPSGFHALKLRNQKWVLLASALCIFMSLLTPSPGYGATFIVDRSDDDPTATACTASPNDCSLRGAIINANGNPGSDTISLPAETYTLTVSGALENASVEGDLDITEDLTINGAGMGSTVIDGNGGVIGDRVLHIYSNTAVVTLNDLTLQNGVHSGAGDAGGIWAGGTLTLNNVAVLDNTTTARGGGIAATGSLTVNNAIVQGNTSVQSGGGINFGGSTLVINNSLLHDNNTTDPNEPGGGISYAGNTSLTITNTDITGNSAYEGGGVYTFTTPITGSFTQVSITGNSADFAGGGFVWASAGTGTFSQSTIANNTSPHAAGLYITGGNIVVEQSTISGNHADDVLGNGAGIYNVASASLENSTLSGNLANYRGGGILNHGSVQLTNVTITQNIADANSNNAGSGGGLFAANGTITTINSIVASNMDEQCDASSGTISSNGYNLSSDATCVFTNTGDHQNTVPGLAGLLDNGGPTLTHALLPSSPALHSAYLGACTGVDQRGVSRPQGPGCDIGAFEQDLLLNLFLPVILN